MANNYRSEVPSPWPQKGDRLIGAEGSQHLNAWISGQGDLVAHIEGYKRAGEIVWAQIEEDPRRAGIDYLVYPIVFLYRHYVELSIKDIVAIGNYLEGKSSVFPRHHHLNDLWKTARGLIERIGPGCTVEDLDAMTSLIGQLDAVDPESFSFRYPITKDWKPSLPNVSQLNLEMFKSGIDKMDSFFEGARSMFSDYKSNLDSSY